MRAKFLFVILTGLAIATPASAIIIAPSDARSYVGHRVTVQGVVRRAHHESGSGYTYIEIGGTRGRAEFTAVFVSDSDGVYPSDDELTGHVVDVTGTIRSDMGKTELIIESPGDIKVR